MDEAPPLTNRSNGRCNLGPREGKTYGRQAVCETGFRVRIPFLFPTRAQGVETALLGGVFGSFRAIRKQVLLR